MISKRSGTTLLAVGLALAAVTGCGDEAPRPASSASSAPAATASPTPSTNGTDTLPVAEALAAARQAYLAAPSVHIKGTFSEAGSTIAIDVRQTKAGDSTGTITMDGATARVMTIGRTAYMSGDRKFWTEAAGADAYALLKGKWVKTRLTSRDFEDLKLFVDREEFAAEVLPTRDALADKREDVRGQPAFRFTDGSGAGYYVALQGEPYPLRLAGVDGTTKVDVDFLDYGAPVTLTPPPASKVVEAPES